MIDFHCHILPAIDDGAVSIDDSIAMARALSDFGYKTVCCTPHCIKGYYDLTPQKVCEATLMLQADLDNADIHLELWPGMEYMLDEYFSEHADNLLPLGETRLVLCEAPPQAHSEYVLQGLELIVEKGFVPLIAHPERTQFFYEMLSQRVARGAWREKAEEQDPSGFESFAAPIAFFKRLFAPRATRHAPQPFEANPSYSLPETCLFQANLGSFTGYYGPQVQTRAYDLLKINAYSGIASDLHDGASAIQILLRDKFDFNPLLKKISGWDGQVSSTHFPENRDPGRQRELFDE